MRSPEAGARPDLPDPPAANVEQIVADVIATVEKAASPPPDPGTDPPGVGPEPGEVLFFEATLLEVAGTAVAEDELQPIVLTAAAVHRSLANQLAERMAEEAELHLGRVIDRVQQMHDEERRRITRELHDRAGSWLTVAHRHLEMDLLEQRAREHPASADRAAPGRVELASNAIVQAMHGLRSATSALRQDTKVTSLVTALRTALHALAVPGIEISLRVYGDEAWATNALKDEVFLILREAAHNAVSHARPAHVRVVVSLAPDELRASVTDDGVGFRRTDVDRAAGLGLASMRERSAQLDGELRVSSAPGRGTKVSLRIPLHATTDRVA
jgi:signal transduction histidine kinase